MGFEFYPYFCRQNKINTISFVKRGDSKLFHPGRPLGSIAVSSHVIGLKTKNYYG